MKTLLKILISILFLMLLYKISENIDDTKFLKKDIASEFKGVLVDKYETNRASVLILNFENGERFKVLSQSMNMELFNNINLGDTLYKVKNEYYCFMIKNDTIIKKYYYVRISNETRNSKNFPIEWKNKWLESSAWDTIP